MGIVFVASASISALKRVLVDKPAVACMIITVFTASSSGPYSQPLEYTRYLHTVRRYDQISYLNEIKIRPFTVYLTTLTVEWEDDLNTELKRTCKEAVVA